MTSPRRNILLLALTLAFAVPLRVSAHAFLDHADPKVGAKIDAAPAEVKIWFTEDLEPDFSCIEVYDAAGKQIDKQDFHLDPKNKKLAIVSLPALPAGAYKVHWHVVSTDTHKTEGDFSFTTKFASTPPNTPPSTPATRPSR